MEIEILTFSNQSDQKKLFELVTRYFSQDMLVPVFGSGFTLNEKTLRGNYVTSGYEMKKHMINELCKIDESFSESTDGKSYSDIASVYTELVDNSVQKDYLYNHFREVILNDDKRELINLPFKTMYTLNFDDGIENNNRNIEVITCNKEYIDDDSIRRFQIENKSILYKIHGDVNEYLKYRHKLIKSQNDYVTSIRDNQYILTQLSTDINSNSLIFIGCSLDDEIDLIYSASHTMKTEQRFKHTFYVTHNDIDIYTKVKLKNFKIDTVIKLDSTSKYNELYRLLKKAYEQSEKNKVNSYIEFNNPKINILSSSEHTINQDTEYLANSNKCFENDSIINLPSFFITRDNFKDIEVLKRMNSNLVNIIYGHRISGKTYCLLDIYNRITTMNKIYIPPTVQPDEQKLIEIIKSKKDTMIFIDSNTIDELLLEYIMEEYSKIRSRNVRLFFTVTSSDKENLYALDKLKSYDEYSNLGVEYFYLYNTFTSNEITEINEKLNKTLLGHFSSNPKKTILDNIYTILNNTTVTLPVNYDITNKKITSEYLTEANLQTLIILAIQNNRLTVRDIEKFMLNDDVGLLERSFTPLLQFGYIDNFEKSYLDTSSYKLICNSKVWLLSELKRLAHNGENIEKIGKAYRNIIISIKRYNATDSNKAIKEISRYIKFDDINDIFSDSSNKGARKVIDTIYEKLFGILNDNFQYFHQRAKSLSWKDDDVESLKTALHFANKAQHNMMQNYEKNNRYLEMDSYKHICYTKAIINTKISKYYNYESFDANNETIHCIKVALNYSTNFNYLEDDNKKGRPNAIITFIKRVSTNKRFNYNELHSDLAQLLKSTSNISVPFNHKQFSRRKYNRHN